ncbi:hypothetical protein DFH08DRAFT_932678 [Mycena albidolilacea]|uniref:Uncharacterized protein n=1 Tax=Mycena albidolilacea TaxID=1033008 RepID=A0AAD7AE82_9AGAR|nr:hypothetical protein DFH08DRAFT_932678 [Mycena albidolilacea]
MSAAARAEARRKAILSRGTDRLAKLTTSGRGGDDPVYVRGLTPDPPLPTFPAPTNLGNFVGEENYADGEAPRVRSRVPSRASPGSSPMSNVTNADATGRPNAHGNGNGNGQTPDPSVWSADQQAQFLQALMGAGAPPLPLPPSAQVGGVGAGAANGTENPFAGLEGAGNPLAAMMAAAAAAGGPGGGSPFGAFGAGGAFSPDTGLGLGKAPEVAKPKTLVQRLMPAVHLVAVWALLVYFVLVAEPAAHGAGVEGEEPGGIGFAWRWRQLAAGVRKAQLGRAGLASGWGVQALPFFWAFVTLELVLHSLRIFSGFDAFRPPTLLALVLPSLPPQISAVIVHGMKYMQMGSMVLDDVAAVIVGIGLVVWLVTWVKA